MTDAAAGPADAACAALARAGLYVLFDPRARRGWAAELRLLADLGVPWFQLRAKGAGAADVRAWAPEIRAALGADAVWILNDDPELAGEVGADGVHVGPGDAPPARARAILGPTAIVGASGDDPEQLRGAAAAGVSYFGIGTYRTTPTKPEAGRALGPEGLRAAVGVAEAPAVAIGGLVAADMDAVRAAGAMGAAVYGAVWAAGDPLSAARGFMRAWQQVPGRADG